jgi:cytosine/adenosine deaminase-related metal-dependent hydrolase
VEHDVIAPELAHMVKVGVCKDNLDALAHHDPGRAALQMDGIIARIEAGKEADLIVVDGNRTRPLRARARA